MSQSEFLSPACEKNGYDVLKILGKGVYGTVVKAQKRTTGRTVAIKIMRKYKVRAAYISAEIEMHNKLRRIESGNHFIMHALNHFAHNDETCIVFELLQQSLEDFLSATVTGYLPLKYIRQIAWQLVRALLKLKEHRIIHTDLKTDNIMLVDHPRFWLMIKLIDFGNAMLVLENDRNTRLQPRFNRAPEIFLELPYSEAIDMWSLGCVLAELFLGEPLFPGKNDWLTVRLIHERIGPFPASMLNASGMKYKFYEKTGSDRPIWKINCPRNNPVTRITFESNWRRKLMSLDDLMEVNIPQYKAPQGSSVYQHIKDGENIDRHQFIDFLKIILCIDPANRLQAPDAHKHDFFRGHHLTEYYNTDSFPKCALSRYWRRD